MRKREREREREREGGREGGTADRATCGSGRGGEREREEGGMRLIPC